jgi:hypothetical protein
MNRVPEERGLWTRGETAARVRLCITNWGLSTALRGSWYFNDFHLTGRTSFSDLDLVVREEALMREEVRKGVSNDLADLGLPLRVSIHPSDDLSRVTLEDSTPLIIAEFLSKWPPKLGQASFGDYTIAKTVLLLLRNVTKERYRETAARIGTPLAETACAVKLGTEFRLKASHAISLVSPEADGLVLPFIDYLSATVKRDWLISTVKEHLLAAGSISSWLADYMLVKLNAADLERR